jgi:hypothetical protein
MQEILVASIRTDDGVQSRAAIQTEYVVELAELLKAGGKLPPVDVYQDGKTMWMADGFHRLRAHEQVGLATIRANVHKGDRKAARWASVAANLAHGLRRTNADKRRAVEMALEDRPEASDRLIAEHVGVSLNTVTAARRQVPQFGGPAERVGVDSKTYRIPLPPPRAPSEPVAPPLVARASPPPPPPPPPAPAPKPQGVHAPAVRLDEAGKPIPDYLVTLFERGREVQELLTGLSRVRSTLRDAVASGDPLYLEVPHQQVMAALATAYDGLMATIPHAVCPYCHGQLTQGCKGCGGRGAVGEYRYTNAVPRELKA